jgi:hypothetical protein
VDDHRPVVAGPQATDVEQLVAHSAFPDEPR